MKAIKTILTLVLVASFAFCCKEKAPELKTVDMETEVVKTLDPNATYAKAEFTIDGMTCQIGCAATIQKRISKMDGVKSAIVNFEKKLAMVEYNDAKVTPTTLVETVGKVSETYKVSDMKTVTDFSTNKTCAADCKKACCAHKTDSKEGEKTTCKADCKEACCTKKAA